jgi:hypothetical protein
MAALSRNDAVRYLRTALREFAELKDGDARRYYRLFDIALFRMATEGIIPKDRWNEAARAVSSTPTLVLAGSDSQVERAWIASLVDGLLAIISRGYVIPGIANDGHLDLYNLSVTAMGVEWASGTEPVPEDATSYMATLRAATQSLTPVVEQYVIEAVRTYNDGSIFASAVMLGVASEAVVYDLADAVAPALASETERERLTRSIARHEVEEILRRVSTAIRRAAASAMPYEIHEGAFAHLASLQEAIRVQRNKSGHPTAERVEPVAVRLGLSAFPAACGKAYELVEWFKEHPSSV